MELSPVVTMSRPSWLRLFVVGTNSLNPMVAVEGDELVIRVVRSVRIPIQAIESIESRTEWPWYHRVTVRHGGWDYICKFDTDHEAARLMTAVARVREPDAASNRR